MRGWITLKQQCIHIGDTDIFQCVYVRKIRHIRGIVRFEKLYRNVVREKSGHWRLDA